MRILFEILLALCCFGVGYLVSESVAQDTYEEAKQGLEESIQHEKEARRLLEEAQSMLISQEARNKARERQIMRSYYGGRKNE